MEIKSYILRIKDLFSELLLLIKEILRLPHAKKYILLTLPVTFIFIIATFPYDILIKKQLISLEQNHFKKVYMQDVEFSFWDYIRISDFNIIFKDNAELTIKEVVLDASLNPYTTFVAKKIKADMQLNSLQYLSLQGQEFNATLNTNVDITMTESGVPLSGLLKIIAQNAVLKLNTINLPPAMGGFQLQIQPLRFTAIAVDARFENSNLVIDTIQFSGPDLRGVLSGVVYHDTVISNSRLNLSLKVNSESQVLVGYKELFSTYIDSEGYIILPIRGTLNNPIIEMTL